MDAEEPLANTNKTQKSNSVLNGLSSHPGGGSNVSDGFMLLRWG